jgi:hypothetical protein
MIATASAAPCTLLSPASNKIEVIIVAPALPPMDAMPPTTAWTKKRKKAAAPAAPVATSNNALTAMPPPSTAPTPKKGKSSGRKKSTKPINLWALLMWVSMTNLKKHCVMGIANGPFGKRIAPGNPEYMDMLPLQALLHMMPPAQLELMLELTNVRLDAKEKWEMTHQELLRLIGVCMLIASINFHCNHRKLWEGGGATSKYLPSYNLGATGMSPNCFNHIWYAIRLSCQPPEQPDGLLLEQYSWMLVNGFVANINKYCWRFFYPGHHVKANKMVIQWYGIGVPSLMQVSQCILRLSTNLTMTARSRISPTLHWGSYSALRS